MSSRDRVDFVSLVESCCFHPLNDVLVTSTVGLNNEVIESLLLIFGVQTGKNFLVFKQVTVRTMMKLCVGDL